MLHGINHDSDHSIDIVRWGGLFDVLNAQAPGNRRTHLIGIQADAFNLG